MSETKEVIINDAAMDQVIIPMIKSFIEALDSNMSKTEIKRQAQELLTSAQAVSDNMAAQKLANQQKNAASHYESHKNPPESHLHIVV